MLQSSLIVSTLFKTIEYKLVSASNLELNVLTKRSTHHSKTILLNSINVKETQTTPSYLPWLVLFAACTAIASIVMVSKNSLLINNNLMSIVSFLICIFGTLAFLSRPMKSHRYHDSFSNTVLFEFNETVMKNAANKDFIDKLNAAIEEAKKVESIHTNLKNNAELQYDVHLENVNNLLNSGLVDEVLYDRICNTMHEKFYGAFIVEPQINNVIYLKR